MEPVNALWAFFLDMCEWERRAYGLSKDADPADFDTAPLTAERSQIVAAHCTPKRRVYSEPFSCGDPPVYDPDNEDVLEVVTESPRRVVVHTQQRAGFKDRRRFTMLRRGDRWLLDSWQSLSGGRWVRGIV